MAYSGILGPPLPQDHRKPGFSLEPMDCSGSVSVDEHHFFVFAAMAYDSVTARTVV